MEIMQPIIHNSMSVQITYIFGMQKIEIKSDKTDSDL
jgi:hypothetical protein